MLAGLLVVLVGSHFPTGYFAARPAQAADGQTQGTAYAYTGPGPMSSTITSLGYTWFVTSLSGGRTFVANATGATAISFYDSSAYVLKSCSGTSCSYQAFATGNVWFRVSGTANAATTVTSQDGSGFSNAYSLALDGGRGSATNLAARDSSATYQMTLSAQPYTFSASGPTAAAGFPNPGVLVQSYTLNPTAAPQYPDHGQLNNGLLGQPSGYTDKQWAGWSNTTFTLTTDLGSLQVISAASVHLMRYVAVGIRPDNDTFTVSVSADGTSFTSVGTINVGVQTDRTSQWWGVSFAPVYASTVRITLNTPLGGEWLFMDQFWLSSDGASVSPGCCGITAYNAAQDLVANADGTSLTFTPPSAGTYFVKFNTASTGLYTFAANLSYAWPGTQSVVIQSQGYNWFPISLTSGRTLTVTATGATSIGFYDANFSSLKTCAAATCSYVPSSTAAGWLTLAGTAGATLTVTIQDGTNLAGAIPITLSSGTGSASTNLPASSSALYSVYLAASTPYVLQGSGAGSPTGITVLDAAGNPLAAAGGASLSYQPSSAGTVYAQLSGSSVSGSYTLTVSEQGRTRTAAFPFTIPGPQSAVITATGSVWFSTPLTKDRTLTVSAPGASGIYFVDAGGVTWRSCSGSPCSYAPSTTTTWWIQITGTAGAGITVSASDGMTFPAAHAFTLSSGTGSVSASQPAKAVALYQVALAANALYLLEVTGPLTPASVAVFDGNHLPLLSGPGGTLNFRSGTTGTYYVQVTANTSAGSHTVKVTEQGSRISAAFSFTPPGPQSSPVSTLGSVWYKTQTTQNRTVVATATGATDINFTNEYGSLIKSCPNSATCSYTPGGNWVLGIQVFGAVGSSPALTVVDGSDFDTAYPLTLSGGTGSAANSVQAWDWQIYKVALSANTRYVVQGTGSGLGSITALDPGRAVVASGNGTYLAFMTGAAGSYHLRLGANMYGQSITISVTEQGLTSGAAYPYLAPGPQTTPVTSQGYTFFSAPMTGSQPFNVTVTSATTIKFMYGDTTVYQTCTNATTCTWTPFATMTFNIRIDGTAGSTVTLTSTTGGPGFGQATALTLDSDGYGSASANGNANDSVLFSLTLASGTPYVFTGSGPSTPGAITLYDSTQSQLDKATGNALTYLATAAGTYYVRVGTGSSGSYTLQVKPLVTGTLAVAPGSTSGPGGTLNLVVTSSTAAAWSSVDYRLISSSSFNNHQAGSGSFSSGTATIPWTVPSTAGTYQIRVALTGVQSGNTGNSETLLVVLPEAPAAGLAQAGHGDLVIALPPPVGNTTYTITRSTTSNFAAGTNDLLAAGYTGTTFVDGINHVPNASFEWGTYPDGSLKDWTLLTTSASSAVYALEADAATPGGTALHLSDTAASGVDGFSQDIFAGGGLAGQWLTLSGRLRTAGVSSGAQAGAWLELRFLSRDDASLGTLKTDTLTGTNGWLPYQATGAVPANTYKIKVAVVLDHASGDLWVDAIQVEPALRASAFAPGGLQDGATYYYQVVAWNGALQSTPSTVASAPYWDLPDALGRWARGVR